MNQEPVSYNALWIASEICYYAGLILAVSVPVLALILWLMSLVDEAEPNYWYLLFAWVFSASVFLCGVGLKNFIDSAKN